MNRQWIGLVVFGACVICAPWVANAMWRRGVARPMGYVTGFALMAVGVVVVKFAGGLPRALR